MSIFFPEPIIPSQSALLLRRIILKQHWIPFYQSRRLNLFGRPAQYKFFAFSAWGDNTGDGDVTGPIPQAAATKPIDTLVE